MSTLPERLRAKAKQSFLHSGIPSSDKVAYIDQLLRFAGLVRSSNGAAQVQTRPELFRYVNDEVLGAGPILLLEFGVEGGGSLQEWMEINQDPDSRFWGFDSFHGLPEAAAHFTHVAPKGMHDTHGKVPEFQDTRVRIVKGLFNATVGPFVEQELASPPSHPMVVHCDAGLYSSTLYVLAMLDSCLPPGTILIFGAFDSVLHGFRSFEDYLSAFNRQAKVLAWQVPSYREVAMELT